MNPEKNAPLSKTYIDETIISTPKPQATSTVERKGLANNYMRQRRPENINYHNTQRVPNDTFNYIPKQDIDVKSNISSASSQSSLGILYIDNMEDIKDVLHDTDKRANAPLTNENNTELSSDVTEKLKIQRFLAQKALDRADVKSRTSVSGLPSYLLKPANTPGRNSTAQTNTTCNDNESTINLSDLENSNQKPDKLSFESNEITARSSSFGTRNYSDIYKSDFVSKCQAVFEKVKASDTSIAELCERNSILGLTTGSLKNLAIPDFLNISASDSANSLRFGPQDSFFAQLRDELFLPAELVGDKLLKDELSWRREKGSLPIDNSNNSKLSIDVEAARVSCFSGYVNDKDMSTNSTTDKNISVGEFFQRKSEKIDSLNFKESPEKKYAPTALINVSSVTETKESPNYSAHRLSSAFQVNEAHVVGAEDTSRLTNDSIMNATQIAEILSKMNIEETPSRVMDYLLKNKGSLNKSNSHSIITAVASSSSDSSTLKNTQRSKLNDSSGTIFVGSSPETSMKENSLRNKMNIDKSPRKKFSPSKCPRPNTEKSKNTKTILKDTSNILENYVAQNQINAKSEKIETEWTDVKQEADQTASGNNTLSSIVTESPSYSCSELEFSEDEQSEGVNNANNILSGNWIDVCEKQMVHKLYVNYPSLVDIPVTSLIDRWLLVKISLNYIKNYRSSSSVIKTDLPTQEVLLKFRGSDNIFTFHITSLLVGRIEAVLKIEATDMVTKAAKELEYTLVLESEQLGLKFSQESLDFGLVPESVVKKMPLVINNNSKSDLLLNFIITQDVEIVYIFGSPDLRESKSNNSDSEIVIKKCCVLPKGRSVTLYIEMHTPTLTELSCQDTVFEITGKISICLGESYQHQTIKEIMLVGRVGFTRLQFRATCMPMVLTTGETKALQMKNSGVVQMDLSAIVFDESTECIDSCFIFDQPCITLKPNESGCINITYSNSKESCPEVLKRCVRLRYVDYVGANFLCGIEVHPSKMNSKTMLNVPTSSRRLSPSPQSKSRNRSRDRSPTASSNGSPNVNKVTSSRMSQQSRASSQNSGITSSLKYLQDGKLPIETTRTELVWGCLNLGKTCSQEFTLRNRSHHKICLQATISGKDFKIVKDQSENLNSVSLKLHAMESRTMTVIFSPTSLGACTDRLLFLPIDCNESSSHSRRQRLALYGYGGYSSLSIQNVAKDPSGKMWLSFGHLDGNGTLDQSFILRNIGSLTAFALLNVQCKALYPFMDSNVKISPSDVLVPPRQEVTVTVSFTPRREDFKYLQSSNTTADVSEIASVQIVSGPEPSRGRIRRLFRKLTEHGGIPYITSDLLISKLSATLPNEQMPADLSLCKESASGFKDILRDLVTREVILTVERSDMEKNGFVTLLAADDTCMFQSVCDETVNATLTTTSNLLDAQQRRRISGGFCIIEPTKLLLTPPVKNKDTVIFHSKHSRPMPFEIFMPAADIEISPRMGVVPPGEAIAITISCAKEPLESVKYHKIKVYVENEVMDIEIKVLHLPAYHSYT